MSVPRSGRTRLPHPPHRLGNRRLAGMAALVAASAALLLASPGAGLAGNWPGWRGPTGAGATDETDLPLTWGGKNKENVLWKAALEGRSHSSPIVWGDQVFVTAAGKVSDQEVRRKVIPEHFVLCYAAADGKQLWRASVPHGPWADGNGWYATPTPVTDGQRVYAWFGSGVIAAVDFDGKLVWHKEHPGPYSVYPSISSSPVLFGDTVLILCDQNKDSFLLALDKATGEVRWEQKRPSVRSSNSTPVLVPVGGRTELVAAASNALQGLDPADGKLLWWCAKDGGYWTSLTHGAGLVYADSSGGRGIAVEPGGTGDVNKGRVKWQHPNVPEGLGCPVISGDYLYRVHKPGVLKCWRLSTGELLYSERLEGISFLASPFVTPDGRLYFASAGRTYVVQAGPRLKVLATNTLPDGGDDGPSPAVSGGRIFLKTSSNLFCVGKK